MPLDTAALQASIASILSKRVSKRDDRANNAQVSITAPVNLAVIEGVEYVPLNPENVNRLTPRPYQLEGIRFLRAKKRAFLCDAPGLGKTLQLAYAAEANLPVLVAVPTYLTKQWFDFLTMTYPNHKIINASEGDRTTRQKALSTPAHWHIINIEMFQARRPPGGSDTKQYKFAKYKTLIIDEAHHLRGRNASKSRNALAHSMNTEYLFLSTGTPIYNRPDDLFHLLRMIDPHEFTSYYKFIDRYCNIVQTPWGPEVKGTKAGNVATNGAGKRVPKGPLADLFAKYSLTRSYVDVGMQLPELINNVVRISASDEVRKRYDTMRLHYRDTWNDKDANSTMEVMQALRRMTAAPKLATLAQLLTDTDAMSGTAIFTWYKDTARSIGELLGCPSITGEESANERVKIAKSDNLIVATQASLAEGVDLTHLHTVVFFELDYVPGRHYQALSRVRRHGGAKTVRVYYLMVENTIDEVLYHNDQNRADTIRSIVREALA